MKQKNITPAYSSIQLFYWGAFACISAFSSAYLLDAGLSSSQIGILIAAAGIASSVLQPVIAAYADRPSSASLRTILIIFGGVSAAIAAGLLVNNERSALLCALLYWAEVALLQAGQPLVNALSMACVNQGMKLNFGAARAIGSLGYAIVSWALGKLTAAYGAGMVPVSILSCYVLFTVLTLLFPFRKQKGCAAEETKTEKRPSDSPIAFFGRHKRFGIVVIGLVLIFISLILLNNFTLQIVMTKGGGSAEMGTAAAISAVTELPVMFLFGAVVKKVKSHVLLRIAPFFFFLKNLLTLLLPGITAFYAVQLTQMFGWPVYCVAGVYYVNELMDGYDSVKGQAYLTMAYSVACVIASVVGGRMIDTVGVNAMLLFGCVTSLAGALIIALAADRTER